MKWKTKQRHKDKEGDTKVGLWFFMLPHSIDGYTYWLTFRKCVLEAYMGRCASVDPVGEFYCIKWRPIKVL